ncbi:myophilin [Patella vulgata]|uniref:myophilin n=1 Tax=Patella vulgata TaxID=6465 RepID=UPI00217F8F24|nr:myophilin [Patella vulgata]
MANSRATKSGLALESQNKISNKYDSESAEKCLVWLKDILEDNGMDGPTCTSGDQKNLYEQLKDGLLLGRLANVLAPGAINPKKLGAPPGLAFKQMELIGIFAQKCRDFGVPDVEIFQTVDLYEQVNLHQVVVCLSSTARKAQSKGMKGFGPKESEANVRNFSEEQLKAGQGVIGLQMGSNKGASQAGQSFGKARHIVD